MSFPIYYDMCNLHIKETEISRKRSKRIKNWKITYSVILSVLSNKTNLILRFSSPLRPCHTRQFSLQLAMQFLPRIILQVAVRNEIIFYARQVFKNVSSIYIYIYYSFSRLPEHPEDPLLVHRFRERWVTCELLSGGIWATFLYRQGLRNCVWLRIAQTFFKG